MPAPVITALPTAPQRTDSPTVFSTRADAHVAALTPWTTQVNAMGVYVDGVAAGIDADVITVAGSASAAATSATNALVSENNAAASATTALNAPATQATSTTSLTIGVGSKSLTLAQTGKAFAVGQWVMVADTSNPSTNWMLGAITAFNSGTGAMTVNVVAVGGSGTIASWAISPSAPQATNNTIKTDTTGTVITGNTTLVSNISRDVNSTSGAIILTFPASPAVGDWIWLSDYAGTFATNNVTINRNGKNIDGLAEDFIMDISWLSVIFVYQDNTRGWGIK
jgi:hypothetical protein